jgi:glycosyltransferase involved in cell wall biosynthesis
MSNVIACVSVYDHAEGLSKTLQAIRRAVPKAWIVVVDGAYAQYPHDKPYSTDGTIDVARSFADAVITRETAWPSEIAKRNAYLVGAADDLYFRIDADEEPQGEWIDPPESWQDIDTTFVRSDIPECPCPLYTIFRHEQGLEYRHTHYALWVGEKCRNWNRPRPVLPGIRLFHRIGEYSVQRRADRAAYHNNYLKAAESPHAAWIG